MSEDTTADAVELDRREHVTTFDTHRMFRRLLVAGLKEAHAEALVDQAVYGYSSIMDQVATKEDFARLEESTKHSLALLEVKLTGEINKGVRSLQISGGVFALVFGLIVAILRVAG